VAPVLGGVCINSSWPLFPFMTAQGQVMARYGTTAPGGGSAPGAAAAAAAADTVPATPAAAGTSAEHAAAGTFAAAASTIAAGLEAAAGGTSGSFAVSGSVPIVLPGLTVEGVGPVGVPFTEGQAAAFIAAAERAPFGRKEATVYDDDVRKTWQLPPSKFRLENPAWEAGVLAPVLTSVKAGLGCGAADDVRAELYKLLLYETGSHFKPHRDTEKTPGMFATLVIVLPSVWTGGEVCVRHAGTEVAFGPTPDSRFTLNYVAFFADCEHEVKPVTSGYRLALVYNVTVQGARVPAPPALCAPAVERVTAGLRNWEALMAQQCQPESVPRTPSCLVFMLEHKYTEADVAPSRLKGKDRTRAEVLARAVAATPGAAW
jgi:hypothetical protein